MATRIQLRRDTAANWTSFNPILAQGEFGLDLDSNRIKMGDGTSTWTQLSYQNWSLELDDLDGVTLTNPQNGDFLRYNGSASVWINDPVNLSTDTVGDYVQSLVAGTGVTLSNNSGEGSTPTVAIGQAVGTSSSVTFGHVSAPLTGNVIGDLTGNADTASALETARTISLTGDVSGSVSFDGSANINISTVVNTASVALDELYGVSIVPPVEEYQVLQHNGTVWTNEYPDTVSYVRNADSVTLTPGMVVYIFGGNGDHATVKRADNSSDTTSSKTLGVVAATITAGNNGPVVTRGYVDSINLSTGYTEGDVLWLGKTGAFTKTKPSAPDHLVYIGVVVRATNNGIVYVACQNGYELEELHNVKLNGTTDGQYLRYNSASAVWIADTINLGTDTSGNYMAGITAGTGVQVSHTPGEGSDATISIGQDVGTGQSVTFAGATIDAIKIGVTNANTIDTTSGNLTIDSSGGTVTIADNLIVDGTLTVSGSVTYVNTQNLQVGDAIITLNHDETGVPSENAGIEVERGTSANVFLQYNETSDKWELTNNGSTYSPIETTATVDTSLKQQLWLNTVYAATTGVLPNSPSYTAGTTDLNGGTGIGAKLTATTNGTFELDGAPVPLENRILVKNQANALHNGIYKVTATGSASATWELTRASDFNNSTFGQTIYGKSVRVATGSVNALQVFAVTSVGSVSLNGSEAMIHVIGTDPITWSQVSGKATLIPGNGLQITNNELSLPTINQSNTASTNGATNFVKSINVDSYGRLLGVTTNNVLLGLGTDTVGDYVQSVSASAGTGIIVTGTGEGATVSIGSNATAANSASAIVMRDSSGNFSAGTITAELSGNASTANTLYASKSIGLTGDLSGSVSFDGSQDVVIAATIQPNSVALGTDTTGNYMSGVSSGTGISVSHTPSEGSTATVSLDATLDNLSDVTVPTPSSGDFLKWNGTAWVNDPINLGTDTTGNYMSDLTQGTGVTITHTPGEGSNATVAIGQSVATTASVTFANVTADLVGNVTGNVTGSSGSTTGNAATATALQNARAISLSGDVSGSVSFNGTSDVSITATIQPNSVALGTDTTGNYMSDLTQGTGVTITHTPSEGSNATIAIGQAVGTSSSVTFAAVSAPVIGNVTGNSSTATKLQTSRTIELTGDVTGSATFDGSANATINATVAANSVALGTDTTGDYVSTITAGTGVTVTGGTGETSTPTIAIGQAVATSSSVTFARVETTGNVVIGGNLQVTGTTTTVNSTNLAIEDTFIYLNDGSTISNPDLGWAGNYNDGTYAHAGLFRDATDGKFKFFDSYTLEPTNPINIGHASYSAAPVVAETFESTIATGTAPISVSSSTVVTNLNADKLDGQDGSYYAPVNNASFTGTFSAPSGTITSTMIADGTIVDADINASAAIDKTKISGTAITAGDTGTVTSTMIADGTIVNGDINASAAIALSKLASGTSAQIVLANGSGVPTYTTVSGDVTISNTGVVSIAANSVALGTDTTGDYVSSLVAGTGVTLTNNSGESATPTVAIGQAVGTASNVQFANVTATGLLTVGTTSGSEGGEIQFLPASTGNTLSGNITMDIYQNKLRIFEAGGSTRGVYIDLSAATAGVGTNLSDEVVTNAQVASYTLVLSDKGKLVEMGVGTANNLTVPLNSSVAFPVGTEINILQTGAGQTTVVATGGVTINGTPGLKLRAQWSYATLIKRATDTWVLVGDISA